MNARAGRSLGSIEEERQRRLEFLDRPDGAPGREFKRRLESFGSSEDRERIRQVWAFAGSLRYDHPGQSAEVYLAHPLRVATLYLDLAPTPTVDGVATCLVHNVLEVTDLDVEGLAEAVGRVPAEAVALLTVERPRQWDADYKEAYYRRIAAAGSPAAPVKVVDKFDNLFMLHLNPSAETRERYLHEIDRFLIPLARSQVPSIVPYLSQLVEDNRRMGHVPRDAFDIADDGSS